MTETATLAAALRDAGITAPALFQERYGVALATLTPADALALIQQHGTPRRAPDYALALEYLRVRLEHGLTILATHPSDTNRARWLRLGFRAIRIIAAYARHDPAGESAWTASPVGRWYSALQWPNASPEIIDVAVSVAGLPGRHDRVRRAYG